MTDKCLSLQPDKHLVTNYVADPCIRFGGAARTLRRGQKDGSHRQCRAACAAAQYAFLDVDLSAHHSLGRGRLGLVRRHGARFDARFGACARAGGAQVGDRAGLVDFRLLRHQTPAHNDCRTHQRHTPRDGAGGRHARLRRAAQPLSVDRRGAGSRVALHAEPFEPARRGGLRP